MAKYAARKEMEENILQTAHAIFSVKGWEGTNLQDIADAMGISRGPIYYYFKSKKQLFEAMFQHRLGNDHVFARAILFGDGPFFSRLERMLLGWVKNRKNNAYMSDLQTVGELESCRIFYSDICEKIYEAFHEFALKGIEEQILRPDINVTAFVDQIFIFFGGILFLTNSPIHSYCKEHPEESIHEFIKTLQKSFGTQ